MKKGRKSTVEGSLCPHYNCRITLLLFGHVKSQSHAVVLLAEFAHGLQRGVARHGSHRLQHLQQVFAFEGQTQSVGGAGDVSLGAKEQGLELDGAARRIVFVAAAHGDALHLALELVVLGENELRVAA